MTPALLLLAAVLSADGSVLSVSSRGLLVGGHVLRTAASTDYSIFQFAPTAGTGMGSACACTVSTEYPVGANPYGIAFDGTNIWTANFTDSTVTKLTAATGALVGTYSVGASPHGIAYDATTNTLWTANYTGGSTTKVNASTGATIGTYTVGANPTSVVSDGTSIWVTNYGDATVTKLTAATGAVVGTYTTGAGPVAVHYDGVANVWTANYSVGTTTKIRVSDGVVIGTYNTGTGAAGTQPYGVTHDNAGNIWIANLGENTVTELVLATGALVGTYSVAGGPHSVIFDGTNIWTANFTGDSIAQLNASTGAVLTTYPINTGANPHMIVAASGSIWTADYGDNTATKLTTGTTPYDSNGSTGTASRASRAYCDKSNGTSLANGDLIQCSYATAMVMNGGAATLGVNFPEARTNTILNNTEMDLSSWSVAASGVAIPVVTANAGISPDGLMTAERVDFPAVADATNYALAYNTTLITASAAPWSACLYVRGVTGVSDTGTLFLSLTPDAVTYKHASCSYVSTVWTRVLLENQTLTAVGYRFFIGVDRRDAAFQVAQPAQSVYLSRGQLELGGTCSPPIDTGTTGALATRAGGIFSLSAGTFSGPAISIAATYLAPTSLKAGATVFQLRKDSNNDVKGYVTTTGATSTFTCDFRIGGVSSTVATAGNLTVSAANRVACAYDGVTKYACLGGTCSTSESILTLPTGALTLYVGGRSAAGNEANGTVRQVCAGPVPGLCI